MMQVIQCDSCGHEGMFGVELKLSEKPKVTCVSCGKFHITHKQYFFCNFKCFFKWMVENKIGKNTKIPLKLKISTKYMPVTRCS